MVQDGAGGSQVPQQVTAFRDAFIAGRDMVIREEPAAEVSLAVTVAVCDADPRRLGVHAAISVPGAADDCLPRYVPRDADGGESGVRARVAGAAERAGIVLLVGGSWGG